MLARVYPFVLAAMLAVFSDASIAADLRAPAPKWTETLREDAILYQIRATFDVVDPIDIPKLLRDDAHRYAASPVSGDEQRRLNDDLAAEGSYYIVSLAYLVSAGGPVWPADKASAIYESEATQRLTALRQRWLDATRIDAPSSAGEMLSILRGVDEINAWTEGRATLTPDLSHFDDTESLVQSAIESTE
jgi:hypothetical protein